MDNKVLDTPGRYNYRGYAIVMAEGNRVTVRDNYTGRIVILDERITDIKNLDRILDIIDNTR